MPRRPGWPKAPSPGVLPIREPRISTGLEMTARRVLTVRSAMTRSGVTAQLMNTPRTTPTAGTARSARRPGTRARLLSHPRALHLAHQGRRPGPAHLARPATRARRARRASPVSRSSPVGRPPWIRLAPVRRARQVPPACRVRRGRRERPACRVRGGRRPPQAGPVRPAGRAGRLRRAGRQRRARPTHGGRQRAVRPGRPRRRLLRAPRRVRASRAPRRGAREKTRPRIVTGMPGRNPAIAMHRPTGSGGQWDSRPGPRRTAGPTFTAPRTRSGRRKITIRRIPMGRRMIPTAPPIRMARPILTGPGRTAGPTFTVPVTATVLLATAPLATARRATDVPATAPLVMAHPTRVPQIRTGRPPATPRRARPRPAPRPRRMRLELPHRRATPRHLARRGFTPQPRRKPASRYNRPPPGRAPWPDPGRRRRRAPRDRRSPRAV
jgi:hypothetical protein